MAHEIVLEVGSMGRTASVEPHSPREPLARRSWESLRRDDSDDEHGNDYVYYIAGNVLIMLLRRAATAITANRPRRLPIL